MDGYGKKELLAFYDRHLEKFGDTPQALRWTSRGQEVRYRELSDIAGPLEGRSILDYGCGKGDFLSFLKEQGIDAGYTGADVNGNLIRLARDRDVESLGVTRLLRDAPKGGDSVGPQEIVRRGFDLEHLAERFVD